MSAITGICDFLAIAGSASASSCEGTATLTIWHPVAVSSAICCNVALTSAVRVVVIDCTDTGAPPPTGTACLPLPTMICLDVRRGASGADGIWGSPRLTVMSYSPHPLVSVPDGGSPVRPRLVGQGKRIQDVGSDQQQAERHDQREHSDANRDQL